MIRLPSAQRTYDDYYSGDPSFVQLPANATDDEQAEHLRKWKIARQTGDIAPMLAGESKPTRFGLRLIQSDPLRLLHDMLKRDSEGNVTIELKWISLVFRCAIVDVANLGDTKIKTTRHPDLGVIASTEICDTLDAIDPEIIGELGIRAWQKSNERDPK